jgi:hypothetical protein
MGLSIGTWDSSSDRSVVLPSYMLRMRGISWVSTDMRLLLTTNLTRAALCEVFTLSSHVRRRLAGGLCA